MERERGRRGREKARLSPLNLLILPLTLSLSLHFSSSQRDGCPRIVNLGQARVDLFFDKKKLGGRGGGGGIA